jgi:4-diphosphocytidyl-2-C-methyl-D-erythritol kinase
MPQRLVARCPAKVNLTLSVLGRRADGYHEIDTVFQAVDLWDTLTAWPAEALTLTCDDPSLPVDGANLVLRAAEALRPLGRGEGAAFHLQKAIPVQGGLGGGSSNAAAALLLAARLWNLVIGRERLAELGAGIGADVPFFLVGGTARGRSRGDRIEPLPFAGRRALVLGCPPYGVSTREVYEGLTKRLTLPSNGVRLALPLPHNWWKGKDFDARRNDLEPVAFDLRPELEAFRDGLLSAGAQSAMLSGSGSTVYGVFDEDSQAAQAAEVLRRGFPSFRLLVTHTIDVGAHLVSG